MYLSKTIYVRVWNCPKGAWICKYHPELAPLDANTHARFKTGNEVGDLARGLFGPSVNVTVLRDDGSLDLPAMIRRTAEEMEKGTSVICEASFSYEGLYCAVDLLKKEGDSWAIYEVKSSSDGLQDKYIADVSYQKYVLEHCGLKVTGVYLVCIDSSYILGEEGLERLQHLQAGTHVVVEPVHHLLVAFADDGAVHDTDVFRAQILDFSGQHFLEA